MSVQISPQVARRLREDRIAWFTTVRADGTPQPTPVWFLWQDETVLIYSQPKAHKLRNIAAHPRVALNLNSDKWGGALVIITGQASVEANGLPADRVPAYLDKYREAIRQIQMTPESFARSYSVAIRVTPTRVRAE